MSTSAKQGLGKLWQLECHSRWLQQQLRRKQFELLKVPGEENPADLFTNHLESERKFTQLISLFNCQLREGRAESAPQLKRAQEVTVGHFRQTATAEEASEAEYHLCSNRLPRQLNPEEIRRCFPAATSAEELGGEEDQSPEAELADPVPALDPEANCLM